MENNSTRLVLTTKLEKLAQISNLCNSIKVPNLHEVWTWEGDTSILPHKLTEILNQVAVYDESDPKYAKDDPFDFEIPYKANDFKKQIKEL